MQTLLHIRTSLFSQDGESSRLPAQYVRNFLGFLGMADVSFVYAEGLAMGEEPRNQALDNARESVASLPLTANPTGATS